MNEGDPAILNKLINEGLDIENLKELPLETIKDVCKQCSIPIQQKSKVNKHSTYRICSVVRRGGQT